MNETVEQMTYQLRRMSDTVCDKVDADRLCAAADKIEGLEADLESAVAVAFKRGAEDWTRLNYPKLYATLKEGQGDGQST